MTARTRSLAPDLARGLMLLLIAMAYASVYVGAGFGTDVSGLGFGDRATAAASAILLDNRAFPLFAILFGAGLAWSVGRRTRAGADDREIRRSIRRRGGLLLGLGAIHALLVFPGEILTSYGLALLVLGWLLFRSVRTRIRAIWWLSILAVITVPIGMIGHASTLASGAGGLPGYTTGADWAARLIGLPISPPYIAFAYPLLLLVAIGFEVGRRGLVDDPAHHLPTLRRWAALGLGGSILGALPSVAIMLDWWSPGITMTGLAFALQVLTGVLGGMGLLALFTVLGARLEARGTGPLSRAIAAVGRRSLTFYLLDSVLVAVILHPDLLGLGTSSGPLGAMLAALAVWLLALVLASILERAGREGPVESLMRRLAARRHASRAPRPTEGRAVCSGPAPTGPRAPGRTSS